MTPPPLCPCCQQPMRILACNADRPDVLSADCWTVGCDLYGVTLGVGEHEQLTPAVIQRYVAARRVARKGGDARIVTEPTLDLT